LFIVGLGAQGVAEQLDSDVVMSARSAAPRVVSGQQRLHVQQSHAQRRPGRPRRRASRPAGARGRCSSSGTAATRGRRRDPRPGDRGGPVERLPTGPAGAARAPVEGAQHRRVRDEQPRQLGALEHAHDDLDIRQRCRRAPLEGDRRVAIVQRGKVEAVDLVDDVDTLDGDVEEQPGSRRTRSASYT
jgi:hypothetical protein